MTKVLKQQIQTYNNIPTVDEINRAEKCWIKSVQLANYENEVKALTENGKCKGPLIKQLRLFCDNDGIIHVGGRLHNAPLNYYARYPILLPAKCHFTELVVLDAHNRIMHAGPESTMTYLRQTYWIINIRQVVKSLLRKCYNCRFVVGLPFTLPDPAPLQSFRLTDAPPFTISGLDFSGHMFVKDAKNSEIKAYICLFTCANTRALHLEVTTDLTTSSFLHAFRRFAARRSLPHKIVSDNASTFLSAAEDIEKLYKSPEVQQFMVGHGVDWTFIPKRAPWFGGFGREWSALLKHC